MAARSERCRGRSGRASRDLGQVRGLHRPPEDRGRAPARTGAARDSRRHGLLDGAWALARGPAEALATEAGDRRPGRAHPGCDAGGDFAAARAPQAARRGTPREERMSEAAIEQGAASMGIALAEGAADRMQRHLQLVEKWNRVHNLTAVRDAAQMVAVHVLDSLTLLPHLGDAKRVVDVGT